MSFCPETRAARRPLNVQDLLGEPIRYDKLSSKEELDSKRHAEAGHPDKPKPAPAKPDPTAELRQRTQGKTLGPSARNEAIDKANDEFSRGVGGLPGKLYAPIGKQLPMRVDNAIRALSPVSLDPNATFEEQAGNLVGGAGAGKAIGAAGRALAPHLGKAASALGDKAAGMVDGVADWMARQRGQVVPSMANSDRINIGRILSESSEEAARRARASERAARKGPQIPTGEPDPLPLNGSTPRYSEGQLPPPLPTKSKPTGKPKSSDDDLLGIHDMPTNEKAPKSWMQQNFPVTSAVGTVAKKAWPYVGVIGGGLYLADMLAEKSRRFTGENPVDKLEARRDAQWGANEAKGGPPAPNVDKKNARMENDRRLMEAIKEAQRKRAGQ
jgi:hypothetical protein